MKLLNSIALVVLLASLGSQSAQASCEASITIRRIPKNANEPPVSLQGCKITHIYLHSIDNKQLKSLRGMVAEIPKIFVDANHLNSVERLACNPRYLAFDLNVTRAEIYVKNKQQRDLMGNSRWTNSLETDLSLLGVITGFPLLVHAWSKEPLERSKFLNIFALTVGGILGVKYGLSKIPYASAMDWQFARSILGVIGGILPMNVAIFSNVGPSLIPVFALSFPVFVMKRTVLSDSVPGVLLCFDDSEEQNRQIMRPVYSDSYEKNDFVSSKLSDFCQSVFKQGSRPELIAQ